MKKDEHYQNKLIAQSKRLVEGKYNYSTWELRVFIEMIQNIKRTDQDFKPVRIYIKDLMKTYGSKSNDDYRKISEAATRLIKKSVKLEYISPTGKPRVFHSPLVVGVDVPGMLDDFNEEEDDRYIELIFSQQVKPLLLNLKENFLLYDKRNILKLKSKFSIRLYQLLKSWERNKQEDSVFEYDVSKLRSMLLVDDKGNPLNQYKQYSQFKHSVILKAQKDLKAYTDICFSFSEIKKGKRVHQIKFHIRPNHKNKPKEKSLEKEELPVITSFEFLSPKTEEPQKQEAKPTFTINPKVAKSKAMNIMIAEGISFDIAQSFVLKYDSDEELVAELQYIKKQLNNKSNILSKTALMVKMLEQQNFKKITIFKKAQEELRKQEEEVQNNERTLLRNQHKDRIEELRDEFKFLQDNVLNQILEGKDQTKIDELVSARVVQKPQIRRAIKRAKDANNVAQEQELIRSLFVKDIKDKKLQNFKEYIAATYQYKIVVETDGEFLKFIEP